MRSWEGITRVQAPLSWGQLEVLLLLTPPSPQFSVSLSFFSMLTGVETQQDYGVASELEHNGIKVLTE